MLTNQDKKDISEIVTNAINDLVKDFIVPGFELVYETMATKKDLKKVEIRLDSVERKLDRVIDNQLVDHGKLKEHEKDIKKLQSVIATS